MVVADGAEWVHRAAAWLADGIRRSTTARGQCRMALAGGETPRPIYAELARAPAASIPWDRVEVFFTDERAVPPDDPQSNYRMVEEALLARLAIARPKVHRMEGERPDLDAAARDYEALLPPRLDVLLLGMGPDGHTASLFPGGAAVSEHTHRVVPVVGPKPPPRRLTITPPVVALARRVAVVAAGTDKAEAAARALDGPFSPTQVPAQIALGGTWFLDRAAAAHLKAR